MTTYFINNRILIATIAAVLMHMVAYNLMLRHNANPTIDSNLLSQNISIKFSEIFIDKSQPLKVLSKKPVLLDKKPTTIQREVAQTDATNQEISDNEVMVMSEFKLNGTRVAPKYPKRALRLKQEGVVYLRVLISALGMTEKIIFVKESQYVLLNKSAFEAVSQWKFQPSIIGGVATRTWIEIPVEFKIT